MVLYVHPIKQGLKHWLKMIIGVSVSCSLCTSNKTRIETQHSPQILHARHYVLYVHPIKQGLKLTNGIKKIVHCLFFMYIQ